MDYRSALDYLQSFTDYEKSPGFLYTAANYDLRRMEELLGRLGDPHLAAKSIHLAGTKGKGSTAAMIASALHVAGYRTGLFTSPHLHTFRERIQVSGELITEGEFASLMDRLRPEVEEVNRHSRHGRLTTFEVLAALAFTYFREKRADFQVVEAGLGGRLDATNVVRPEICVITSISFDHMEVLGNTLAQIAREKAGIIKPSSVVISSPQQPEAANVIAEVCLERGARLIKLGNDVTWEEHSADISGQSFVVRGINGCYQLRIPLLGEHQKENAAAAVATLEALADQGVSLSPRSIALGLAQVRWPARMDVLRRNPTLVVDGAHNADSARRLRETITQYFDFDRAILVLGTSSDKDIAGIAKELSPLFTTVIVTRSRHPRAALSPFIIAEFARYGIAAEVSESVAAAVTKALTMANERDLICVTGSLFVAAEAIEYDRHVPAELYSP